MPLPKFLICLFHHCPWPSDSNSGSYAVFPTFSSSFLSTPKPQFHLLIPKWSQNHLVTPFAPKRPLGHVTHSSPNPSVFFWLWKALVITSLSNLNPWAPAFHSPTTIIGLKIVLNPLFQSFSLFHSLAWFVSRISIFDNNNNNVDTSIIVILFISKR